MLASLYGLPAFIAYFAVALGLVALYLAIYMFATAHDELALIRNNNPAAAVALGMSLLGFSMPLSSAIIYSNSILDMAIWGIVAIIVQIIVYWLVRLLVPGLSQKIAENQIAPALLLGAISLAAGLLNAASMTYTPV